MTHAKADYTIEVWSKTNFLNTSAALNHICIHLIILLKNSAASNDTCKHLIILLKKNPEQHQITHAKANYSIGVWSKTNSLNISATIRNLS